MAVFIPVVNAAQFTFQYSQQDGSFAENEHWIQRSAPWTSGTLLAMAAALKTWWTTGAGGGNSYQAGLISACSLQGIGYRDMTTQHGLTGIYQTGMPLVGGDAEAGVPLGVTFSLTSRTGLAGRNFRGRTYIIGMGVSHFTSVPNNLVLAGHAASLVAMMNSLISAVPAADATCTLVVCSRYGGVPTVGGKSVARVTGLTTPITTFGFHDLYADFQRRRAPGHNRHN